VVGRSGETGVPGRLRVSRVIGVRSAPRPASREAGRGASTLDLLFAIALALTLSAAAVPQAQSSLDHARAAGAARYLAGRLQQARLEAVRRSADVGFQFVSDGGSYTFRLFLDGDGNGIRSADIRDGIDVPIGPVERLADRFAGMAFGIRPGLPPLDPGGPQPSGDPIKLGVSDILSFSALGSSSSGSVFLLGRGDRQIVLRIYGATGKVRLLAAAGQARVWTPL
jgi:hypothetical protein